MSAAAPALRSLQSIKKALGGGWAFRGLVEFLRDDLSEEERGAFWRTTLPHICALALRLPALCAAPIPLLLRGRADAVSKLERLADDFGFDSDGEAAETEKRRKKNLWVPEDHSAMFSGNTDDHFRLGIKVTKASVRLYVDFFGSDILVASPLGTCFGHSFQSAKRASRGFGFFFSCFFGSSRAFFRVLRR